MLSLVYYQKISVGLLAYDYFGTVLQIFFRVRPGQPIHFHSYIGFVYFANPLTVAVIRFLVPQTTTSPSIEVFLCLRYHRERQKKLPNANSIDQWKQKTTVLTIQCHLRIILKAPLNNASSR